MFGRSMQEKKDYIARIAGEVFFAKGFKESSLQDVSAKGNLSKAGIYHYFKSKEEMLLYILMKNTQEGIQALEESLARSDGRGLCPEEAFKELVRSYADYLLKNRKISLLVLRERHQLSGKNRKVILEKERAIFNLLKSRLTRISRLNSEIHPNLILFQIMSMIHWMGYWFNEKGQLSGNEAIEQSIHLVFNGILMPE